MNDRFPELPPTPTSFKVSVAVVVLLGLAFLGLIGWAIIRLVTHFT